MHYMYIHVIMAQFEIHHLIQIELIVCQTIIMGNITIGVMHDVASVIIIHLISFRK